MRFCWNLYVWLFLLLLLLLSPLFFQQQMRYFWWSETRLYWCWCEWYIMGGCCGCFANSHTSNRSLWTLKITYNCYIFIFKKWHLKSDIKILKNKIKIKTFMKCIPVLRRWTFFSVLEESWVPDFFWNSSVCVITETVCGQSVWQATSDCKTLLWLLWYDVLWKNKSK